MRTKLVAEQRCELIRRVADWCFDETESWEPDNIGTGLAYLFWAIASPDKGAPFDATLAANTTLREYPMETAARAVELADETLTTLALVKFPQGEGETK